MLFIHYKTLQRKRYCDFFMYYFFRYHRIFFGSLIFKGRKLWAFNFFNKLKVSLKLREKIEPNLTFFFAMIKITPNVLLFPYKIGGKVQGVPLPISWKKKFTYATKWVIKLLRDKYRRLNLDHLIDILISAIHDKGLAIQKKKRANVMSSVNRFLIKYFK